MWEAIFRGAEPLIQFTGELSREQWTMVFGGVVVIGFFCLRGFGSRSSY